MPRDVLQDIIWAVGGRGFGPHTHEHRLEDRSTPRLEGRSDVARLGNFENTRDMHEPLISRTRALLYGIPFRAVVSFTGCLGDG